MADGQAPDIDWKGRDVVDRDGEKVGSVQEVYVDEESGRPNWLLVKRGLLALGTTFVPFAGAEEGDDGTVRVPYTKDQVGDAPPYEPAPDVNDEREAAIYRHYDLEPPEREDEDEDRDEDDEQDEQDEVDEKDEKDEKDEHEEGEDEETPGREEG